MASLNIEEAEYGAFVDITKRYRWFVIITVLLSTVILTHLYLEKRSHSANQLKEALARRLNLGIDAYMKNRQAALQKQIDNRDELKSKLTYSKAPEKAELQGKIDKIDSELAPQLAKYGEEEYSYRRTTNNLQDVRSERRELPLLGLEVSENDFLPVIAAMLMVFAIGVWLNLRSMFAAVQHLTSSADAGATHPLLSLHFTFTGPVSLPIQDIAAWCVQMGAIVLPAFTMGLAYYVDIHVSRQMYASNLYSLGQVDLRARILFVISVVIAVVMVFSCKLARRIDKQVAGGHAKRSAS